MDSSKINVERGAFKSTNTKFRDTYANDLEAAGLRAELVIETNWLGQKRQVTVFTRKNQSKALSEEELLRAIDRADKRTQSLLKADTIAQALFKANKPRISNSHENLQKSQEQELNPEDFMQDAQALLNPKTNDEDNADQLRKKTLDPKERTLLTEGRRQIKSLEGAVSSEIEKAESVFWKFLKGIKNTIPEIKNIILEAKTKLSNQLKTKEETKKEEIKEELKRIGMTPGKKNRLEKLKDYFLTIVSADNNVPSDHLAMFTILDTLMESKEGKKSAKEIIEHYFEYFNDSENQVTITDKPDLSHLAPYALMLEDDKLLLQSLLKSNENYDSLFKTQQERSVTKEKNANDVLTEGDFLSFQIPDSLQAYKDRKFEPNGMTLLHYACLSGNARYVEMLGGFEIGALIAIEDKYGLRPLDYMGFRLAQAIDKRLTEREGIKCSSFTNLVLFSPPRTKEAIRSLESTFGARARMGWFADDYHKDILQAERNLHDALNSSDPEAPSFKELHQSIIRDDSKKAAKLNKKLRENNNSFLLAIKNLFNHYGKRIFGYHSDEGDIELKVSFSNRHINLALKNQRLEDLKYIIQNGLYGYIDEELLVSIRTLLPPEDSKPILSELFMSCLKNPEADGNRGYRGMAAMIEHLKTTTGGTELGKHILEACLDNIAKLPSKDKSSSPTIVSASSDKMHEMIRPFVIQLGDKELFDKLDFKNFKIKFPLPTIPPHGMNIMHYACQSDNPEIIASVAAACVEGDTSTQKKDIFDLFLDTNDEYGVAPVEYLNYKTAEALDKKYELDSDLDHSFTRCVLYRETLTKGLSKTGYAISAISGKLVGSAIATGLVGADWSPLAGAVGMQAAAAENAPIFAAIYASVRSTSYLKRNFINKGIAISRGLELKLGKSKVEGEVKKAFSTSFFNKEWKRDYKAKLIADVQDNPTEENIKALSQIVGAFYTFKTNQTFAPDLFYAPEQKPIIPQQQNPKIETVDLKKQDVFNTVGQNILNKQCSNLLEMSKNLERLMKGQMGKDLECVKNTIQHVINHCNTYFTDNNDQKIKQHALQTCLLFATELGDLELVKNLGDQISKFSGNSPSEKLQHWFYASQTRSSGGETLLHLAVKSKKMEMVRYIEKKMNEAKEAGVKQYSAPGAFYGTNEVEIPENIWDLTTRFHRVDTLVPIMPTTPIDHLGLLEAMELDRATGRDPMLEGSFTVVTKHRIKKHMHELGLEAGLVIPAKIKLNFLVGAAIAKFVEMAVLAGNVNGGPGIGLLSGTGAMALSGICVFTAGCAIGFLTGKGLSKGIHACLKAYDSDITQAEQSEYAEALKAAIKLIEQDGQLAEKVAEEIKNIITDNVKSALVHANKDKSKEQIDNNINTIFKDDSLSFEEQMQMVVSQYPGCEPFIEAEVASFDFYQRISSMGNRIDYFRN